MIDEEQLPKLITICCPCFTKEGFSCADKSKELIDLIKIFFVKKDYKRPWIIFSGGTGTGKSTIFNAVCGLNISQAGVERPKTSGLIAYAPEGLIEEKTLLNLKVKILPPLEHSQKIMTVGSPECLTIFEYPERNKDFDCIIVDTPDIDSLDERNHETSLRFLKIADLVIFITSPEKYADEIPSKLLKNLMNDIVNCDVVFNKATDQFTFEEIINSFHMNGIDIQNKQLWIIPYEAVSSSILKAPAFKKFTAHIKTESDRLGKTPEIANRQYLFKNKIAKKAQEIAGILYEEKTISKQWIINIEDIKERMIENFLQQEKNNYLNTHSFYIKEQVRKLFLKYDPLIRVRSIFKNFFDFPFTLFKINSDPINNNNDENSIDITPLLTIMEQYHNKVLESFSPKNKKSPLYIKLIDPELKVSAQEISARIEAFSKEISEWLKNEVNILSKELVGKKKWGIYSTAALWGLMVIFLQVVTAGGFTLIEGIFDALIAPFISKGTMELFAYKEIKNLTKKLATRYQDILLGIIEEQKIRYISALNQFETHSETFKILKQLTNFSDINKAGEPE